MVMPPQMVGAPPPRGSGGRRPDVRVPARPRAGAAAEVEVDVAPATLAQLESSAAEPASLGAPGGQRRGERDRPVARVDLAVRAEPRRRAPAARTCRFQAAGSRTRPATACTTTLEPSVGRSAVCGTRIAAVVRLRSAALGRVGRVGWRGGREGVVRPNGLVLGAAAVPRDDAVVIRRSGRESGDHGGHRLPRLGLGKRRLGRRSAVRPCSCRTRSSTSSACRSG